MPVVGKIGERHRIVRIVPQNLFKQDNCLVAILLRKSLNMPMRTHHSFPLAELPSFLTVGALNFGSNDSRRNSTDDALRDLILNGENIFERAIVPFRPDVVAIASINQLGRDTHATASLAHASFEHVTNT